MVSSALSQRIARDLPAWRVEGKELVGDWKFDDFAGALAATVRVGALAQAADHHPELALGWGKVRVRLTTHSAGELTEKDVALAARIQAALGAPNSSR